jgi:hypothetical protein
VPRQLQIGYNIRCAVAWHIGYFRPERSCCSSAAQPKDNLAVQLPGPTSSNYSNLSNDEVPLFRRPYRRTHHRTQQRGPFGFLRKPVVQLSILGIAVVVICIIALTAGK